MWMNAQKGFIWNSYSIQTELPALLVLGLENINNKLDIFC